jgi:uncharacterized protein
MHTSPHSTSIPRRKLGPLGRSLALMAGLSLAMALGATGQAPRANESTAERSKSAVCGDTGSVWWTEIITPDVKRTRSFYEKVAGWTPKVVAHAEPSRPPKAGETEYTIMMAAQREAIGVMIANHADAIHPRGGWFTYIQVDDVDISAAAALANGGKVLRRPFDIPGLARIAVIEDPMGAAVGLVTPIKTAGC